MSGTEIFPLVLIQHVSLPPSLSPVLTCWIIKHHHGTDKLSQHLMNVVPSHWRNLSGCVCEAQTPQALFTL